MNKPETSHPLRQVPARPGKLLCLGTALLFGLASLNAVAGPREQLKRIHDRLTGTPPSNEVLAQLNSVYTGAGGGNNGLVAAALAIMDDTSDTYVSGGMGQNFYNVTLKNMATPWTNEAQTVFAPLNDYSAMVIGMVANNDDFRELLYANYYYIGSGAPPAATNNTHYETLESNNANLARDLTKTNQPVSAPAGIMTTRAAARAFYIDGTNRAMFRFTILNHLCYDLEQIKDNTRPFDRIRQDVSRSPGGDSRIFMNACAGCHAGMDPMAQAFAYYQWDYPPGDEDGGQLVYTPGAVQPKYLINASNFKDGYETTNDAWENRWRSGDNAWLLWDTGLPGNGQGAQSLGQELAHSKAFAVCQVKKVFKTVCQRDPDVTDTAAFDAIVSDFTTISYGGNTHNLKRAFAGAAAYCSGN
ncbi:MAG: hypothetical protein OEZ39_06765 [Gammaproteobacteria bacterium]|nr:hypothetical protein [Gammaproteobacteria bacterium]MDH5651557.1 hypothetical protein [Gammaproteobacteria bacterium]